MKTRILLKSIGIVLLCTVFQACSDNQVEADMERWCDCQQKAREDASGQEACVEMMLEISDKYSFDPEAIKTIQEKAVECK